MIEYEPGDWVFKLICRSGGSVLPRAFVWGSASGVAAFMLNAFSNYDVAGVVPLWTAFTTVLGLLVVFRNNEAYTRFWEGASLVYRVKGEWLNAASSLVAFSSAMEEKQWEVKQFQAVLMRLMSMMHCSALQMIADVEDENFEIISPLGIDPDRVRFMMKSDRRTEVMYQWIQRLIVEALRNEVLDIPAPIITRVFQQLSQGIAHLHDVRRIKEVPLPYPYTQAISVMMVIHWILTPIVSSQSINSPILAGIITCGVQTAFWATINIAAEIQQPFGEDANDLPMPELQVDFNDSLELLIEEEVQSAPDYVDFREDDKVCKLRCMFGETNVEKAISNRSMTTGVVQRFRRFSTLFGGAQSPLRLFSPSARSDCPPSFDRTSECDTFHIEQVGHSPKHRKSDSESSGSRTSSMASPCYDGCKPLAASCGLAEHLGVQGIQTLPKPPDDDLPSAPPATGILAERLERCTVSVADERQQRQEHPAGQSHVGEWLASQDERQNRQEHPAGQSHVGEWLASQDSSHRPIAKRFDTLDEELGRGILLEYPAPLLQNTRRQM